MAGRGHFDRSAVGGDKRSVYLPYTVIDSMRGESERQGRSMSWLFDRAWRSARTEVASAADVQSPKALGIKAEKMMLYLHRRASDEVAAEAALRGCTISRVVALAWSLAAPRIRAMPAEPMGEGEER